MPWSATLPETCHRTYHQIVENMAEVKCAFVNKKLSHLANKKVSQL